MTNKKIIGGLNHQSNNMAGVTKMIDYLYKREKERGWEEKLELDAKEWARKAAGPEDFYDLTWGIRFIMAKEGYKQLKRLEKGRDMIKKL